MAEKAIHIEGFDEVMRQHVHIHLRVVTCEESKSSVIRFAAPRGFLPEAVGWEPARGDVAARRAVGAGDQRAAGFGQARGLGSSAAARVFAAPYRFVPER